MFKRISILLAAFAFSAAAQATLIDFTGADWEQAIIDGGGTAATIGNVTLTADNGSLTFNRNDSGGCKDGQPANGLTCDGDGIGINNDEITQGASQQITLTFDKAINITNIILLDLFSTERGYDVNDDPTTGEIAIIDGIQYFGPNLFAGGYYATGFSGQAITSIVFSGNLDSFSDYALAAIEISAVPVPGAAILFGSALLGFFGFKRRRIA